MAKARLTIEIDDDLANAVETVAGSNDTNSEVIERALTSYFSLRNSVNRIHAQLGDEAMSEDEADAFGVAEVKAYRAEQAGRR